jgi:hypothetical protein
MAQQLGWFTKEERKKGKTWVFHFYTDRPSDGKRVEHTLVVGPVVNFPKEGDARAEVERRKLHEHLDQPNFSGRVTFGSLAQHYTRHELGDQADMIDPKSRSTIERYLQVLNNRNRLIPRWGDCIALDIKVLDIEQWLIALKRQESLENPTLDKIRRVMSLVYKHAQRHGLIPRGEESNPVKLVHCATKSNYKATIITPEQAFAILQLLPQPERRIGYSCRGEQPWLGRTEAQPQPCGCHLRVLQRGASNVYFPHVVSSIYLPLWAEQAERSIIESLERPEIWDALTSGLVDGKKIDPVRCDVLSKMWGLNPDDLVAVAQRKLDGTEVQPVQTEEEYRRQEYSALLAPRGGPNTDLFVEIVKPDDLGAHLGKYFSKVALVKKLRETRALAGFSRVLPPDPEGAMDRIQPLKLDQKIDWLPATVVRGEGIFLELNANTIQEWLENSGSPQRTSILSKNFNQRRVTRGQRPRGITATFVLLHALAHSLINQLSFDCGYGSASLRERIYCNVGEKTERMHGILIYTSSGDSEGTMGGLVRQGEPARLLRTLSAALQKAQWCSSDPICIETSGQGTDSANLAACHGCLLISETSCEEGNRLLDRAMLVGKPTQPEIGFFASMFQ